MVEMTSRVRKIPFDGELKSKKTIKVKGCHSDNRFFLKVATCHCAGIVAGGFRGKER